MNKEQLVQEVAERATVTKKMALDVINAFIDTVKETVSNGDNVMLIGFGTFTSRKREARTCRNPQNGLAIQVEAKTVPVFKAGKKFKETVNV